ncbi:MAG: hypothetical protein CME65_02745 [Halobacteriovoraceae bacterium]|nr:hypothetical protein [Halobacteriovoraceae bacterium]|tara:strand:- start:8216 stop:12286 length:4071 start_codon:yes stop_codon:yes gene_type:complete
MNERMKYLSLSLISLLFIACGEQPGSTSAKISVAALTGSSKYGGGLVFYARTLDRSKEIIRPVPISDTLNIDLPNGNWDFTVLGWDGGDHDKIFEGAVQCDSKENVNLGGGELVLDFAPSFQKCLLRAQAGVASGQISAVEDLIDVDNQSLYRLAVGSCIGLSQKIQEENISEIPPELGCGGGDFFMQGAQQSWRIIMLSKKLDGSFGGLNESLISDCRPLTESYRNYSGINLPLRKAIGDNRFIIQTYESSDCSGIPAKQAVLDRGLGVNEFDPVQQRFAQVLSLNDNFGNTNGENANYYTPGSNWVFVAIDSDGCSPAAIANPNFAAGGLTIDTNDDGTPDRREYLICSKDQFQNIASFPDAIYNIGKDLDMSGNSTITGSFGGDLRGNNYTLTGITSPLFETITSTRSERMRISDIVIDAADIENNTDGVHFGILAKEIIDDGAGNDEIEIDRIRIENSQILDNSSAGLNRIGLLVGYINFDAPNANESLFIRKIDITSSDIISASTGTSHYGGLIGEIYYNNTGSVYGNLAFEENSLGYIYTTDANGQKVIDLNDDSGRILINAGADPEHSAGGLIGTMNYGEIRSNNRVKLDLVAQSNAGGLVGKYEPSALTEQRVSIQNSHADVVYTAAGAPAMGVGGVIGLVFSNSVAPNLDVKGVVSKLKIGDEGSEQFSQVNNLGGVVGWYYYEGAPSLRIYDSRVEMETYTRGTNHGGLVGAHEPNTAPSNYTNEGDYTIKGNLVYAILRDEQNGTVSGDAVNFYRGGLFGKVAQVSTRFNTIYGSIEAAEKAGGHSGRLDYSWVTEDQATMKIRVDGGRIGGAFGELLADPSADTHTIKYLDIEADLDSEIGAINCQNASDGCGALAGACFNPSPGTDLPIVVEFLGKVSLNGGDLTNTVNDLCPTDQAAGWTDGTEITASKLGDTDCTGLSGPFSVFNGSCQQLFLQKWQEVGIEKDESGTPLADYAAGTWTFTEVPRLLAGSIANPYELRTKDDWNAVGSDAFLLTKSFEVINDNDGGIDFSGGPFVPFGGNTTNKFSGNLFGAGTLYNIDFTSADLNEKGVVNILCGGKIGLRDYPLYIENSSFDLQTDSAGIIGRVTAGDPDCGQDNNGIFVRAYLVDINNTGALSVLSAGGLIGDIVTGVYDPVVEMDGSAFYGSVQADNGATGGMTSVGGLIGRTNAGTGEIRISNTAVTPYLLSSGNNTEAIIGGMIGAIVSNTQLSVEESYISFDAYSETLIDNISAPGVAGTFGGVVGKYGYPSIHNFRDLYIDFSRVEENNINAAFSGDIYGSNTAGSGPNQSEVAAIAGPGAGNGAGASAANDAFTAIEDLIDNWSYNDDWVVEDGLLVLQDRD